LTESTLQPDLVLAIDGSNLAAKAENGFPGAEFGYITIASVLIDLKLIGELEKRNLLSQRNLGKLRKHQLLKAFFLVVM
jgi:NurA domain.